MLFQKHKKQEKKTFDRETQRPVLKCSICNGEQVAGFKDIHTGRFEEVCFVRSEADLENFAETYDLAVSDITKEY